RGDRSRVESRRAAGRRVRAAAPQRRDSGRRVGSLRALPPVKEYPYWWDTVPKSEVGSQKSEVGSQKSEVPKRADVVVVGAGYTGLSAARRLAMSGASVVVLDRERAGWGASSRNGGQVLTELKLDPGT